MNYCFKWLSILLALSHTKKDDASRHHCGQRSGLETHSGFLESGLLNECLEFFWFKLLREIIRKLLPRANVLNVDVFAT